jgi:hypothetical protein
MNRSRGWHRSPRTVSDAGSTSTLEDLGAILCGGEDGLMTSESFFERLTEL